MPIRTITDCFQEILSKNPNATAVVTEEANISFLEVEKFSNQLAQKILQLADPIDQSVILMMGRSPLVIPGMLAVLKTAKICIPIHPANNEARMLENVFEEHHSPIILTDYEGINFLEETGKAARVINIETFDQNAPCDSPNIQTSAYDPAFVIYTSGSTGEPKGVLHTHRAIVGRIEWYRDRFDINKNDTTLMLSTADSISGIVGMFRPLLTGGKLIVFSIRRQGFESMTKVICEKKVTLLPMVNSVFRHYVETLPSNKTIDHVRMIILGGEAMTSGDVSRYRQYFSEDCILLNTLGCTELPTYRYFVVDRNFESTSSIVPIGHAVPGNEVLILNDQDEIAEPGEVGEIAVKSKQLSLGYWNREEETRSRFFDADDGSPCYKTGDLGSLHSNGILEFLGRKDSQVKIIGNRVELAEIENELSNHPLIGIAAVGIANEDPENVKLFANLVFEDKNTICSETELADYLRQRLPDYMIPLHFIPVSSLPLTRTGKVDHKALIKPNAEKKPDDHESVTESLTPLEKAVSEICKDVLRLDQLSRQVNLINFGANSLIMMQIVNRIQKQFDIRIPLAVLFNQATVTGIADYLEENQADDHREL